MKTPRAFLALLAWAAIAAPLASQPAPTDAAWSFGSWSGSAMSPSFLFEAPWDPSRILVVGDRSWMELERPAVPLGRWLHWLKPSWFSPDWQGVPDHAMVVPLTDSRGGLLVVRTRSGWYSGRTVEVWDARGRSRLHAFPFACPDENCRGGLGWLPGTVAAPEPVLLTVSSGGLRALRPSGELLWELPDVSGDDLEVAQFDDDPSLEIVTTDGTILDVESLSVQATLARSTTLDLATADLDLDGDEEILAVGEASWVDIHDGATGSRLRRFGPIDFLPLGRIYVPPVERGKPPMALAGTRPAQVFSAFRLDTGEPLWELGLGGPVLHVGESVDLDGDGVLDIFFSGEGEIPIRTFAAAPSLTGLLLENFQDFLGPVWGDFDRDGRAELVAAARGSLTQSQLLVFDGTRFDLKHEPIRSDGTIYSLRSRDLDNDGRKEILIVGGAGICGPSLVAVELSVDTTETTWRAETCNTFTDAEVGDIDGDGNFEVVGKGGPQLEVFDARTGAREWTLTEPYFDTPEFEQTGLEFADLTGDGVLEILVLGGSRYGQRRVLIVDSRTRRVIQRLVGRFDLISTSLDGPTSKRRGFWTWDGMALIEYRQIGLDLRPAQWLPWPYPVSSIVESGSDLWLLGPGAGLIQFRPGQGILWRSGHYDLGGHGRGLAFTPGGPHRLVAVGPSALRAFP
jgi:hypothetical protein